MKNKLRIQSSVKLDFITNKTNEILGISHIPYAWMKSIALH